MQDVSLMTFSIIMFLIFCGLRSQWCGQNRRGAGGKFGKSSYPSHLLIVSDVTDASGSPQQGALQQRPLSAARAGSASRVASSPHALLLSTRVALR